jgi:glycopeptide antibiotics resistance protein
MQITHWFTIGIGVQLFIIHAIATTLQLYWTVWWLDIVMHFLGGVWLVFVWRTLTDLTWLKERYWNRGMIFAFTLFIMILWEYFGIYVEQGFKDGFVSDTIGDIMFGVCGVVFGVWLIRCLQSPSDTIS